MANNNEINRLNFSNMVQKQLDVTTNDRRRDKKYARPLTHYPEKPKWAHSPEGRKWASNQANIQGKLNNIVAYVHTQLAEKQVIPKPIPLQYRNKNWDQTLRDKIETPYVLESRSKFSDNSINRNSRIIDNINRKVIIDNPCCRRHTNIPRMKVLCDQHAKKRSHNSVAAAKDSSEHYVALQRLEQEKRQHDVYDTLIEDHKQLKIDRNSIAAEIHSMRSCLDEIRGRLDVSLKKLDRNKTVGENEKEKKKEKTEMPATIQQRVIRTRLPKNKNRKDNKIKE